MEKSNLVLIWSWGYSMQTPAVCVYWGGAAPLFTLPCVRLFIWYLYEPYKISWSASMSCVGLNSPFSSTCIDYVVVFSRSTVHCLRTQSSFTSPMMASTYSGATNTMVKAEWWHYITAICQGQMYQVQHLLKLICSRLKVYYSYVFSPQEGRCIPVPSGFYSA